MEIIFTVGAQTSGTWIIGNAKIEVGSTATAFVNPDFANELIKCQRFFELSGTEVIFSTSGNDTLVSWFYKVSKRTIPVVIFSAGSSGVLHRSTVNFSTNYILGPGNGIIGVNSTASAQIP